MPAQENNRLTTYITVYCDGNGDGHSIALFPDGKFYIYHEPGVTNNEAEYNGVILSLFAAPQKSFLMMRTDSQLVCGHLDRGWKVNHEHLRKKFDIVRELQTAKEITLTLEWIPRKENIADKMLRRYLKAERATKRSDQSSAGSAADSSMCLRSPSEA